jgi:hypothetical protein
MLFFIIVALRERERERERESFQRSGAVEKYVSKLVLKPSHGDLKF